MASKGKQTDFLLNLVTTYKHIQWDYYSLIHSTIKNN